MTELNLEAIKLKAANPVTATDQEWAEIVISLLAKVSELEDEVENLNTEIDGLDFDLSALSYGAD